MTWLKSFHDHMLSYFFHHTLNILYCITEDRTVHCTVQYSIYKLLFIHQYQSIDEKTAVKYLVDCLFNKIKLLNIISIRKVHNRKTCWSIKFLFLSVSPFPRVVKENILQDLTFLIPPLKLGEKISIFWWVGQGFLFFQFFFSICMQKLKVLTV
jgi:hypothetical protein